MLIARGCRDDNVAPVPDAIPTGMCGGKGNRPLRAKERKSRKHVSSVSTFIGAIPWVTIRIQTKSGLEKRSLGHSITIQATCPGKLRKRDRISSQQKNRIETKANRSTNGVPKIRLQVFIPTRNLPAFATGR